MTRSDPSAHPVHEARQPTGAETSMRTPHRTLQPICSEAIFAGQAEVQIVHRGSIYRLKQTALGKLILTK